MTTEERLVHLERQEGRLLTLLERMDERIEQNKERIEQNERHLAALHRLWVRLAQKHGWLEDEDLWARHGDEEIARRGMVKPTPRPMPQSAQELAQAILWDADRKLKEKLGKRTKP